MIMSVYGLSEQQFHYQYLATNFEQNDKITRERNWYCFRSGFLFRVRVKVGVGGGFRVRVWAGVRAR